MADREIADASHTERTTFELDDVLYAANAAGSVDLFGKAGNVLPGGPFNALAPSTGITGDGSTDDAANITALLSAGGDIYFPAGTYKIDAAAGVGVELAASLNVTCHPKALFKGTANVVGDLFDISATGVALDLRVSFSWRGGIIDMADMKQSSQAYLAEEIGLADVGTSATTDGFSFRDGYIGAVHVENVIFSAPESGYLLDYRDPTIQHWMGSPLTTGNSPQPVGGDSAIFANCGDGPVTITGCTFLGTRDTAIYISGKGDPESAGGPPYANPPASVLIANNNFFWCSGAVSVKSVTPACQVSDNYAYGCFTGFSVQASGATTGPTGTVIKNNVVELYDTAYQTNEAWKTTFQGNTALNGGYLDWFGKADHCRGEIILASGASGSVDTLSVNSVNQLSAPVSFDTDLATTAQAVADNINANDLTPNYLAMANGTSIHIQNATSTTDANGLALGVTTTTIDTTGSDTTMTYAFTDPRAMYIEGSDDTLVDGFRVEGTDATWDANRTPNPVAFRIIGRESAFTQSGVDEEVTGTTIKNVTLNNIGSIGGEYTKAGVPNDPTGTRVHGLHLGDSMDDYTGFLLLGAGSYCDYQDERVEVLTTDSVSSDATTVLTPFAAAPFKAGAWYEIDISMPMTTDTDNIFYGWTLTGGGTQSGRWWGLTGGTAEHVVNTDIEVTALPWTTTVDVRGYYTATTIFHIAGLLSNTTDGTVQFRWRKNADVGGNATLLTGSRFRMRRIG